MRKNFFENTKDAVYYLIFLSLVPVFSILAQFLMSDTTMYVSILVAGFSMTYDYFVLIDKKTICTRLWIESLVSTVCLIITTVCSIWRLIIILYEQAETVVYLPFDFGIIMVLVVVVLINILELIICLKREFAKRNLYSRDTNEARLINGAQKI